MITDRMWNEVIYRRFEKPATVEGGCLVLNFDEMSNTHYGDTIQTADWQESGMHKTIKLASKDSHCINK